MEIAAERTAAATAAPDKRGNLIAAVTAVHFSAPRETLGVRVRGGAREESSASTGKGRTVSVSLFSTRHAECGVTSFLVPFRREENIAARL